MARIIEEDPEITCECKNCHSILAYKLSEQAAEATTNESGQATITRSIECPKCSHKVITRID